MAKGAVGGNWQMRLVGVLVAVSLGTAFSGMPEARAAECPNEQFRTGFSSGLPACRAYELVSPPDAAGRTMLPINTWGVPPESAEMLPTEYVSPDGDSIIFATLMNALPEAPGATGVSDLYEARRAADGWHTSVRLSPGGEYGTDIKLAGASPDHSYASASAPAGNQTVAPRIVGRDGTDELAGLGSLGSEPYPQVRYLTSAGQHIIFSTGHQLQQSKWCQYAGAVCKVSQLEPEAPPTGTGAIYDRSADGPTHVVSMLPGNIPFEAGEEPYYKGVARDGSAVAFEVRKTFDTTGPLYVRVHNGEIGQEETQKIAEASPTFAGISDQGRFVFYVVGGEEGIIHRYDTTTDADATINPAHPGEIVNVSGDGSRVYFISDEEISGEGVVDEPNLYVWSAGSVRYVTTVAPSDLVRTSPNPESGIDVPALTRWTSVVTSPRPAGAFEGIQPGPGADSSRTTPDGSVLVFESRAELTAYDNAGHTEIYRWDDVNSSMICVSCNFGHAAESDARLENLRVLLPPPIVDNVSEDGSRVFFETEEPLDEGDVDGLSDIYEWRGGGGATPVVDLISSGKTIDLPRGGPYFEFLSKVKPPPNTLLSITPSGSDVVFLSTDELTFDAPKGGAVSIYDARTDGGIPAPPAPVVCLEEGCKPSASSPPSAGTGSPSESLQGSGNLPPHKARRHRKHRRCKAKRRHKCARKGARQRSLGAKSASLTNYGAVGPPGSVDPSPQPSPSPTSDSASAAVLAATEPEYGLETVKAELSTTTAGAHPDFTTDIVFNHHLDGKLLVTNESTEELTVSLPPGLLGDPNAVRQCTTLEFISENCPIDSQVGLTSVLLDNFGGFREPIYNLQLPNPGEEIARFGFFGALFPVYIDVKVRTASDYGVTATVYGPSGFTGLITAKTVLWANPSDPVHDEERFPMGLETCEPFCGSRAVPRTNLAFMANPAACQDGRIDFAARSYQLPGQVFEKSAALPGITDCTGLPFSPTLEAEPTSHVAGAPTGLKTKLVLPQHLLATERATATMREARVTLPEGMQVAAGAANWIGTCSDQQVGYHEEVDTNCPDSSKLGTATIKSPDLPEPIEGTIYQRSPRPGHQLGLWLTSDALGLHIKLPGELEPDKQTGRLTAVFRDLPQVPVEEIDLNVWGGPRAPLRNPDHCGTFTTDFSFSPHSNDPAVTGHSDMQITEGCNQGFSPTLKAGVTEPTAGKFSPFVFDLNREDGQQALRGFELKLPEGELAKIKGVPLCSDADAAAGSCPPGSRIGSLQATTGPGPEPFTLPAPGKAQPQIYLSGPYQGSPFSIVSEVPAQAGPFDLGVLAVRSGLDVEPETGRALVKADPLPQFFEGVGIAYRHLHAVVDRPEFNLNPTDCRELAVSADVTSTQGTVAHPSARFQVDGCKALKFKPKLSLKLRGGTKRAQYPALTAVLKARKGDANIAFTSVALPHSEFLAQEHIGTICTRKQFAVDKCPKGSVYGKAKAYTPLLDKPLSGPVYLRSSDHPLPDLVAKLGGQLEIDLVGRIDSIHGGIRTTFETVPDAPVSRFVLQMKGGAKGLLTNSTDICRGAHKASVAMRAQNGRRVELRQVLESSGCGNKKLGKH